MKQITFGELLRAYKSTGDTEVNTDNLIRLENWIISYERHEAEGPGKSVRYDVYIDPPEEEKEGIRQAEPDGFCVPAIISGSLLE